MTNEDHFAKQAEALDGITTRRFAKDEVMLHLVDRMLLPFFYNAINEMVEALDPVKTYTTDELISHANSWLKSERQASE